MGLPEYAEWMRFSGNDIESAEFLLGQRLRKIEVICYLSEQCAEKALKAVLARFDDEIPRTLDLRALLALATKHAAGLGGCMENSSRLQPFAVAVRYPYELPVAAGDEEAAIADARSVLQAVETHMKVAVPNPRGLSS